MRGGIFHTNGVSRSRQKVKLIYAASVDPEILCAASRPSAPEFAQEADESRLVDWFHRFTAQKRESGDVGFFYGLEKICLGFFGKLLAIREGLSFLIKAALTMMCATGNEEGDSNSLSVRDITCSYAGVVHLLATRL